MSILQSPSWYNNKFLQSVTVIYASLETDNIIRITDNAIYRLLLYFTSYGNNAFGRVNKFNVYKNKKITASPFRVYSFQIEYKLCRFMRSLVVFFFLSEN